MPSTCRVMGRLVAAPGPGTSVVVWDVASGDAIRTLSDRDGMVSSLCFAPDGWTLAVGTVGGEIEVWDIVETKKLKSMRGHTDGVLSLAHVADGRTMVSGSLD